MLSAASSFANYLESRFVSTVWLPVQLFAVALLAVTATIPGWHTLSAWWVARTSVEQVVLFIGGLGVTTGFAQVLAALLPLVFRLYEGTWTLPGRLDRVRQRAARRQQLRRDALLAAADSGEALLAYPPGDDLLPTRLGNILLSSERHPWVRYRLDGVVAWPRLYVCLPESVTKQVAVTKSQLDLLLTVNFLAGIFAVTGAAIAGVGGQGWLALGCLAIGVAVAYIAYLAATTAALSYAAILRAAFDVHRFLILDALGWRHPSSWKEERVQWEAITTLWLRGTVGSAAQAAAIGY